MESFINGIENIFTTATLMDYGGRLLKIVITIFLSRIAISIGNNIVTRFMDDSVARIKTVQLLLKNVLKYAVYFFAAMIILSILNIPVASLLAGAGILGLAVGFGAQDLVKDVVNGFFILLEDQFTVGDYVETAGISGMVEEIGLRTSRIRNFGGQLHIIPNSEMKKVTNYSDGNMRVMVDVGVSYDENPARVIELLEELCQKIAEEKADVLTEGPKVLGVQELAASSVVIRLWAKTRPMEQWNTERYIRQRAKEFLDTNDIEIPYPHQVNVFKGEKSMEVQGDEQ